MTEEGGGGVEWEKYEGWGAGERIISQVVPPTLPLIVFFSPPRPIPPSFLINPIFGFWLFSSVTYTIISDIFAVMFAVLKLFQQGESGESISAFF